jgi:hypothetical protein
MTDVRTSEVGAKIVILSVELCDCMVKISEM